nr:MAG TPA: hypothetical protein [Caudoviricetes sp.]
MINSFRIFCEDLSIFIDFSCSILIYYVQSLSSFGWVHRLVVDILHFNY